MSAIKATGVVVKKGKAAILDTLSFEISKGTITGLIGPSGSGNDAYARYCRGAEI